MNSVVKWLMYCKHGLFADDNYLMHEAVRQVNIDAQSIANWARAHGLEINSMKTKAMILENCWSQQRFYRLLTIALLFLLMRQLKMI
ncbi:Protein of unknown function [Cotesia congregata]|uniref:Uncharacterized protein n=1 Tax=Cotesia congregata TaxID=51543 RepID=A0A8J2E9Q2_COTCN|nr:Protein of unknown function [Cotesia congregata]